jgi:hypothetical protein
MKSRRNGLRAVGWLRRSNDEGGGSDQPLVDSSSLRQRHDVYSTLVDELDPADRGLLYRVLSARGDLLFDHSEHAIGVIRGVMVDRESGSPRWLVVEHGYAYSLFAVPVAGLELDGPGYRTLIEARRIHAGPEIDLSSWTAQTERQLRNYYGVAGPSGGEEDTERRASCSRAFQDPEVLDQIGWLPAPRTRSAPPGSRPKPGA